MKRYKVERSYTGAWYNIIDRRANEDIIGECDKKCHATLLVKELNKRERKHKKRKIRRGSTTTFNVEYADTAYRS